MRKRNRHVSVWMNEQEYRHLKRQAELAGLGVDPFLRALAAGVQLRPRPPDTYAALLRELSAIGNNVNQIAYWANATKGIGKAEITEAAALVRQAWRNVNCRPLFIEKGETNMRIGLIAVDGRNSFPNLALMRLSNWHKQRGDTVEWWTGFTHYDRVYMSKVFTFTPDFDTVINAEEIITGGTGYKDFGSLPPEVEACPPDYTL